MPEKAFQDCYPDDVSYCFGCGRLNEDGHQIKSYWDGDEAVCTFTPEPYHIAIPGYVYGGLIASLIDCHSTGTATAAAYEAEGREPGTDPPIRFVTGTLTVRFLRPTPMGTELLLRARIRDLGQKKVVVDCSLFAGDEACVQGEVIVIRAPEVMNPGKTET